MTVTERIALPLLKSSAAQPMITHYDDTAGSRVELSVATTMNWAAKTANWLRDEADVEPGVPVACLLPAHWQTLGILLGTWWCGGAVTTDPDGAAVAFVPPGGNAPGAALTAEVSLHPMGLGLAAPPSPGAVDFIEDSRACADDFTPFDPVTEDTAAIDGLTVAKVIAESHDRATKIGITTGARALSTQDWSIPDGLLNVLAVFACGGSLVQCSGADDAALDKRADTEKVTLRLP